MHAIAAVVASVDIQVQAARSLDVAEGSCFGPAQVPAIAIVHVQNFATAALVAADDFEHTALAAQLVAECTSAARVAEDTVAAAGGAVPVVQAVRNAPAGVKAVVVAVVVAFDSGSDIAPAVRKASAAAAQTGQTEAAQVVVAVPMARPDIPEHRN